MFTIATTTFSLVLPVSLHELMKKTCEEHDISYSDLGRNALLQFQGELTDTMFFSEAVFQYYAQARKGSDEDRVQVPMTVIIPWIDYDAMGFKKAHSTAKLISMATYFRMAVMWYIDCLKKGTLEIKSTCIMKPKFQGIEYFIRLRPYPGQFTNRISHIHRE